MSCVYPHFSASALNTEIQLHDSEISEVRYANGSVTVIFSTAYIHESEGLPGRDFGRIWTQVAAVTVDRISSTPPLTEVPIWALGGTLSLGTTRYDQFIPADGKYVGDVELSVQLSRDDGSDGGELRLRGGGVSIELIGEPSEPSVFDGEPRR